MSCGESWRNSDTLFCFCLQWGFVSNLFQDCYKPNAKKILITICITNQSVWDRSNRVPVGLVSSSSASQPSLITMLLDRTLVLCTYIGTIPCSLSIQMYDTILGYIICRLDCLHTQLYLRQVGAAPGLRFSTSSSSFSQHAALVHVVDLGRPRVCT